MNAAVSGTPRHRIIRIIENAEALASDLLQELQHFERGERYINL